MVIAWSAFGPDGIQLNIGINTFDNITGVIRIAITVGIGIPFAEIIAVIGESIGRTQGDIRAFNVGVNDGGCACHIGVISDSVGSGRTAIRERNGNHLDTGLV